MGTKRKTTCGHFGGTTDAGNPCRYKAGRGTDHPGEGACKRHNGTHEVLAFDKTIVAKPQDWDKAVAAAFLWLISQKVKNSAKLAGVSPRALHMWVRSPWWGDACDEARKKWLNSSTAYARRALMENLKDGDGQSARWLLERTDPDLAPPTQRHKHEHEYLHRDEVVRLMRIVGEEMLRVTPEEDRRIEIVAAIKIRVAPLLQEVSGTPEGE